jgi:hypothetical protein
MDRRLWFTEDDGDQVEEPLPAYHDIFNHLDETTVGFYDGYTGTGEQQDENGVIDENIVSDASMRRLNEEDEFRERLLQSSGQRMIREVMATMIRRI